MLLSRMSTSGRTAAALVTTFMLALSCGGSSSEPATSQTSPLQGGCGSTPLANTNGQAENFVTIGDGTKNVPLVVPATVSLAIWSPGTSPHAGTATIRFLDTSAHETAKCIYTGVVPTDAQTFNLSLHDCKVSA